MGGRRNSFAITWKGPSWTSSITINAVGVLNIDALELNSGETEYVSWGHGARVAPPPRLCSQLRY